LLGLTPLLELLQQAPNGILNPETACCPQWEPEIIQLKLALSPVIGSNNKEKFQQGRVL